MVVVVVVGRSGVLGCAADDVRGGGADGAVAPVRGGPVRAARGPGVGVVGAGGGCPGGVVGDGEPDAVALLAGVPPGPAAVPPDRPGRRRPLPGPLHPPHPRLPAPPPPLLLPAQARPAPRRRPRLRLQPPQRLPPGPIRLPLRPLPLPLPLPRPGGVAPRRPRRRPLRLGDAAERRLRPGAAAAQGGGARRLQGAPGGLVRPGGVPQLHGRGGGVARLGDRRLVPRRPSLLPLHLRQPRAQGQGAPPLVPPQVRRRLPRR